MCMVEEKQRRDEKGLYMGTSKHATVYIIEQRERNNKQIESMHAEQHYILY